MKDVLTILTLRLLSLLLAALGLGYLIRAASSLESSLSLWSERLSVLLVVGVLIVHVHQGVEAALLSVGEPPADDGADLVVLAKE